MKFVITPFKGINDILFGDSSDHVRKILNDFKFSTTTDKFTNEITVRNNALGMKLIFKDDKLDYFNFECYKADQYELLLDDIDINDMNYSEYIDWIKSQDGNSKVINRVGETVITDLYGFVVGKDDTSYYSNPLERDFTVNICSKRGYEEYKGILFGKISLESDHKYQKMIEDGYKFIESLGFKDLKWLIENPDRDD